MFSSIFIKRPILATVISLVLVLAGAISVKFLPIAEYPLVSPPTVLVIAHYPGASSQTIAETVAAPIEAQINSVENLIYYSSTCGNDGTYELNVTFEPGSDEDMTLVNVNNAIKLAEHSLPSEVVQNGLIVVKRSPDILSVISVRSSRHSLLDISNWTDIHILDAIQRIEGVGQAVIFGEMKYSMRVWLDPEKMRSMGISPGEVRAAIASQNVQAATGAIGTEYSGNLMQFKVDAKGRLTEPAEYEKIVVRASADGLRQVRLGDIARVELGSETYEGVGRYQGEPSIALAIFKLNHGNALEIQKNIKATMEEIEKTMPDGMHWEFAYDTTRFVNASMKEIVETLLLTFILVVVITWLFLQSWRATIIPAVAIPVSLIGTFLFMHVIGMSINTLTMFALILVIGSVVDDAICVTESCVRMIVEEHKKPLQAAFDTMKQITGALIATTLVVLAVYAPIAFAGGMVGTIYLQFSVTMCVALCLSTVCALTLSPAVAALILKEPKEPTGFMKVVTAPFAAFDWGIRWLRRVYERVSGFLIRWMWLTLIVFAAIVAFDVWVFTRVPGGFLPEEDKGTVIAEVVLPPGASLARTEKVLAEVGAALGKIPGVATILEVPHHSLTSGTGENVGMVIMELEDWSKRRGPGLDIKSIQDQAMAVGSQFPDAQVLALVPPPIQGLGDSGGVTFALQAVAGQSFRELSEAANRLVRRIMQSGKAMYAFTSFDCSTPRPREGGGDGRARLGRLQHAPGTARLVLRQRLQQIREDVPGQDTGQEGRSRHDGVDQQHLRDGAERRADSDQRAWDLRMDAWLAPGGEVQHVLLGRVHVPGTSRRELRGDDASLRGTEGRRTRQGLRARVEGHVLPGEAQRRRDRVAARAFAPDGIPVPRRAVRIVDGPRLGNSLDRNSGRRRTCRTEDHGTCDGHLRTARPPHAHRPHREDGHSDGRVREAAPRRRRWDLPCVGDGASHALPRCADDGALVRDRRDAASLRDWCWSGRARICRDGDVLGNACRDGGGHAPRSAALRLLPAHQRVLHGPAPSTCGKLTEASAMDGLVFSFKKTCTILGMEDVGHVLVPGLHAPDEYKNTDCCTQAAALVEKF